jgi:uncharacterized protein with PIN domain
MGVPCPGCGRQYDVSLFPFGRTIHCTCGQRVGLQARVRAQTVGGELRFIADAMLGRLARWLRILGFDTAYEAHIPDGDLVRRALEEDRLLLTRDRALPEEWQVSGIYVVVAEKVSEQLRELARAFPLADGARLFTRCSCCNTPLASATRQEVEGQAPLRVLAVEQRFLRCPECERVYWRGSHTRRMRRVLEQALGERVG